MSFHDKSPIYRHLTVRLREMILEGVYQNGNALPSVRQVESEQRVNPITVYKAYQVPVDDEFVEKKRGLEIYGVRVPENNYWKTSVFFIDPELPES